MNNKEILKECKQAYELLNDLVDNCEELTGNQKAHMIKVLDDLFVVYYNVFEKTDKETLKTDVKCPHCNNDLIISDLIGYAYVCTNCDENMYSTECDVNSYWWK